MFDIDYLEGKFVRSVPDLRRPNFSNAEYSLLVDRGFKVTNPRAIKKTFNSYFRVISILTKLPSEEIRLEVDIEGSAFLNRTYTLNSFDHFVELGNSLDRSEIVVINKDSKDRVELIVVRLPNENIVLLSNGDKFRVYENIQDCDMENVLSYPKAIAYS